MEKLKVEGRGRLTSCIDPRIIQRMNQHSEVLFGKDHLFEPNFSAPMTFRKKNEAFEDEELLGVEYAYIQTTKFSSKDYYVQKAEEEQSEENEEVEQSDSEDEGIEEEEADDVDGNNHINSVNVQYSVATKQETTEETSPVLEDVLMKPSHLHLPGYKQVENLALILTQLSDGDHHIIPPLLRQQILEAASKLADHDKSATNFVKKYESKWGYTRFARCLGPDSQESSAAQKTKFVWMRYPQAVNITEESRLLYLLIKIIENRPNVGRLSSPTKAASIIKAMYKKISDRVQDDPVQSTVDIPLPNINTKSITLFISKQEKKLNYLSTSQPKVKTHRKVLTTEPMPEAPKLLSSLPSASYTEVQYENVPHESGKRIGEKRRFHLDKPALKTCDEVPLPLGMSSTETKLPRLAPKPSAVSPGVQTNTSNAPILLVVPSQPSAPSVSLQPSSSNVPFTYRACPPPLRKPTCFLPNQSVKPCAACRMPKCGGLRKWYTPCKSKTENSSQTIFTFCPATNKSTTPGFNEIYDNYEHFKKVVD